MMKKDGANYFINKTALSHGSASSQHIGIEGVTGSQGKSTGNNAPKYADDEGFMRGARIAEKI